MKLNVVRICSRERIFRFVLGLVMMFVFLVVIVSTPLLRFLFFITGAYLVISGLLGSCILIGLFNQDEGKENK